MVDLFHIIITGSLKHEQKLNILRKRVSETSLNNNWILEPIGQSQCEMVLRKTYRIEINIMDKTIFLVLTLAH